MVTTAPLLRSESTRPSGYPTSKSQTTLASQTFPSQTGIFQQNYQIKAKPSYTGSAMVGENNGGGQIDSPFHHGSNIQPWTQVQPRPPHQDVEKGQFFFQHAPDFQSDDQSRSQSLLFKIPFVSTFHSMTLPQLCYHRSHLQHPRGATPEKLPSLILPLNHSSSILLSHGQSRLQQRLPNC